MARLLRPGARMTPQLAGVLRAKRVLQREYGIEADEARALTLYDVNLLIGWLRGPQAPEADGSLASEYALQLADGQRRMDDELRRRSYA